MRLRQFMSWSGAPRLLLVLVICVTVSMIVAGSLRSLAQAEHARIEDLFGTPPLTQIPPDTSVALKRITYRPGETMELAGPGPIMLYVEQGELAVPEAVPGQPTIFLYSGPDTSPPPTRSDKGDDVLPPGYAILSESGQLGLTRNPGNEPSTVLAVFLIPEHLEEGASAEKEATAAP